MFIDKVKISIKAGDGGSGHTSFLQDRQTQRGGPDGGDGGHGGDVVFVGSMREDNLIEFRYKTKFVAENGYPGRGANRTGANGKDIEIPVPRGTKILKVGGLLIADITEEGQRFVALHGGAGGRGNARFATSRRQTPNFSQTGVKTAVYEVVLELNCIADVGIIGFPNVGKSTLLSIVTRANPKIANYPFTTLHPNIGVYSGGGQTIFLADIPGLVEGASQGVGLGLDFLKHINRTRLLIHMIDISETDGRDAIEDYKTINKELAAFSSELSKKQQIVVLNKTDCADEARIQRFISESGVPNVFQISCAARQGIDELMKFVASEIVKIPKNLAALPDAELEEIINKNSFTVTFEEGVFVVSGPMVDNLIRGVVLSDTESAAYFHRRLESGGVIEELKRNGMKQGDTVKIADTSFIWTD